MRVAQQVMKMKIFLYEVRKLLTYKRIFIIVLALIIQVLIMFIPHQYEHDYSDEVYKKYIEQISGEYSYEKRDFIFDRADEINEIIYNHDDVITAYKRDEISLDEFESLNFAYYKALAEEPTVEYLKQKCNYFDELGRGVFFYDTNWTEFFSGTSYNYIVALVIICLTIPVFTSEYQSNSISMLLTTRYGRRKVCISKIITVAIVTFAIALTIYMLKYATFMCIKGSNASLGVENLIGYNNFPGISLLQYYVIDTVIKSVSWVVAALFICAVSVLVKSTVFSFFISFIFVVCPYFMAQFFSGDWFAYVFSANQLGGMYTRDLNPTLLITSYLIKSAIYTAFSIRMWERRLR